MEKLDKMYDAIEQAYAIMANVSGGNWSKQDPTWKGLAEQWVRDNLDLVGEAQKRRVARG